MARNISGSAADMLDGLKSRLGFGRNDSDYYDDDYDDRYDDRDYNDRDYDYDDRFDDRDRGYNDDAPIGGYKPLTNSSGTHYPASGYTSRFGRADSAASNLVSIDDVKAHTQVPERLQRDPLARLDGSYGTSSSSSFRSETSSRAPRSEGYDSLFESTDAPTFTPYDPYEAYSTSNPTSYSSARSLTVIKPVVYGDVERVARAVKSGDVVVLVMRNTSDDLSKRILDFSFGVASALEANVECPGDKVFAIARGRGLTNEEKTRLRNQGAL